MPTNMLDRRCTFILYSGIVRLSCLTKFCCNCLVIRLSFLVQDFIRWLERFLVVLSLLSIYLTFDNLMILLVLLSLLVMVVVVVVVVVFDGMVCWHGLNGMV